MQQRSSLWSLIILAGRQPLPATAQRLASYQASQETPLNLAAVEIKAFVPASDLALSQKFYLELGFEIPWSSEELAYVRHGETSFLLQAFPEPDFIKNFQMHLLVENVDDWYSHVVSSDVAARFGVEVGEPQDQVWAMRDFTLFDPSGVLWRIAQNTPFVE